MKLYIEKKIGKSGYPYICLMADFGYRKTPISFDAGLCAEVADLSRGELEESLAAGGGVYIL